ncbi:MAG: metallophosphoesterase [Myxococcota bacterium]|nr:metallophosphoesterase [Myxococcota bacterium]
MEAATNTTDTTGPRLLGRRPKLSDETQGLLEEQLREAAQLPIPAQPAPGAAPEQNAPSPEGEGAPPYTETAYSFDYAGSHFVAVNSVYWMASKPTASFGNRMGVVMPEQMKWLRNDLAAARARGVDFIFVMTHVPGFPNGGHTGDGMWYGGKNEEVNEMRREFWTMMGDYGVSAVFTGHEHSYNRLSIDARIDERFVHPVWQIVTAGAGAPYYGLSDMPWTKQISVYTPEEHFVIVDVLEPGRARLRAVGLFGELIDELELLAPKREWPSEESSSAAAATEGHQQ